ncbi:putative transcriptional regulator, TetR family [Nocardia nova SH22a]|uniref:Putative transcriptional regulator, TetR family n=1 Tax=Nocardia nova SH22a TaxID=1415166 RepID=W5TQW7_9NOCA|nr:TetR/AcrR family transcriptional regulator [Nocardia nova]AHH21343.1 putative transcriptional regulator, TetR family [Nocardia nova SH22a]
MARVRMARENRYEQLVTSAWTIVREEGADALTLGHLAEVAGVTKPVVYSHFPSRSALLVALFEEYDARQIAALDSAVDTAEVSLPTHARAIATSHVDCVLGQGRELAGVIAALEGTRELADFKRRSDEKYLGRCRAILERFVDGGTVPTPTLTAIFGAAEALSAAAALGSVSRDEAREELTATIVSTMERLRR